MVFESPESSTSFAQVQPTATGPNANQNALETLMNGDADAMWVYADQANPARLGSAGRFSRTLLLPLHEINRGRPCHRVWQLSSTKVCEVLFGGGV